MSNYEKEASIRPPIFDGRNFIYWKVRITAYLQSLGTEVWDIVETGYTFPSATPTDTAGKNQYETNAKVVNTLLGSLSQSKFVKVMQLKSAREIWDKIVLSYEGDEQVKREKLQTLRIQYESLRMHNDESVASYFLRIDEIVNCMKNLGEEIKEVVVVEKVLRSLSPKFDSKVSAIEEKENIKNLTMSQLHGILTAYKMRKGGPSDRREVAFKASGKGDYYEPGHMSEEEEESNFVKNIQRGTGRFKGKLPFKCFACGRVGHYAAKCPHKDKLDKGKEPVRWNRRQNKKSYYTHEDSDGLSNSDEDEQGNDNRLLMAFEDDDFLDAINEEGLYEEIAKLKHSPLIKTGLGYSEEASQAQKQTQKPSTSKIYLEAARRKEQVDNQKHNADHQVNQGQFASRMIKDYQVNQGQSASRMNRSLNQPRVNRSQFSSRMDGNYNHMVGIFDNRRIFFNGQCFSCHNFGHKVAQCVAYKTIMTREAQKKRSIIGIMKRTYNNFSALENEIECTICNNFGHEDFECKSRFRQTIQKEQASLSSKTWRKKEPQPESCGIALYAKGQENQWYIDSGCSKHMTGNKEKLQSYTTLENEKKVSFGNDTPAFIKGKGSVQLKEKVKARNVMYVDGLKHNLLSFSQMCDQGTEVIFRSNGCIVHEVDT
eukprot:PITA_03737